MRTKTMTTEQQHGNDEGTSAKGWFIAFAMVLILGILSLYPFQRFLSASYPPEPEHAVVRMLHDDAPPGYEELADVWLKVVGSIVGLLVAYLLLEQARAMKSQALAMHNQVEAMKEDGEAVRQKLEWEREERTWKQMREAVQGIYEGKEGV